MLVVPNLSEAILLDAVVGKTPTTDWTLRLASVISPALSKNTVVGDLTEALDGGYAAVPLVAANWVSTPGSPTEAVYPMYTFVFTGPLTTNPNIVAYYVTRADGSIVYAEMLATPFTPIHNGDFLEVTLAFTLGSVASD